ncbi:hypothetical protein [Actinoplanes regularis]|uniref:hypothetical protein n=1 Tax=Actinoplanes regularis TaxID=52697 RepID=UPI0024A5FC70|nr:hypothetical protein [Actinoplanes regularis]GLW32249.1 hypothetical protein Areg01_51880 [Actinoplanes regularis]
MTVFGPYETEGAAAAEPLGLAVRNLHENLGHHNIGRDVRDLQLSFLREACADAGVELGSYDERVISWLAGFEPATVQVVIGLLGRARAAGAEVDEQSPERLALAWLMSATGDQPEPSWSLMSAATVGRQVLGMTGTDYLTLHGPRCARSYCGHTYAVHQQVCRRCDCASYLLPKMGGEQRG